MTLYRKKPVVVEAVVWDGENQKEVFNFMGRKGVTCDGFNELVIETPEGEFYASVWDYIIKGVAGEFYPCKPDIFHATYEKVEE